MSSPLLWGLICANLVLAVSANALSTHWAISGMRVSPQLVLVALISPAVFVTFGIVASRMGLAAGSAIIDSLLTVGSVLVGLVIFGEWRALSLMKGAGLLMAITGIAVLNAAR